MDESRGLGKTLAYLWRATVLRCPVCGRTPIFCPALRIRRLSDWFTPLDGCPRCGYAFDREPGYFLMAIWAVNYGCGSLLGITLYLVLEFTVRLPTAVLVACVVGPVIFFNLVFARHAKAYFIAFDHLCDPHRRGGDDGGGNRPADRPPVAPAPPARPVPDPEPCETPAGVR